MSTVLRPWNAASIAGLLLTTECLITEIPEKEKKAPAGHGPGMSVKWATTKPLAETEMVQARLGNRPRLFRWNAVSKVLPAVPRVAILLNRSQVVAWMEGATLDGMTLSKSTHLILAVATMLCVMGSVGLFAAENRDAVSDAFLHAEVKPLLEARCFGCHGEPKDREAEFDMRTRAGLLKGGESGQPALVPGDPDKSRMFQAVLRKGKLKMPPKERNRLTGEEIEILRKWIAAGAPWLDSSPLAKESKPKWEYKPEDIWAFQPLTKVVVPKVADPNGRIKKPIDAFILAKLAEKELQPAPAADRVTLVRRATFDLTGLPPTPEEIDAFVKDKSPDAFDNLVERLLASLRYGEKQARHWLDVVRYADTDGYSNDYERPNAWRYRDYVIRSFNSDKPYDQFIREQMAGDELDGNDPEKLIAVGMLRMGPWEQTAMSVAAVTRQQFLDDVTHNVSASFLGLTVGCARCHDHKFDAIPTKDYYRLQSVYAPVQFETRNVEFLPTENAKGFDEEIARVKEAMERAKARLQAIRRKHQDAVKTFLKDKGVKALKDLPEAERPKRELGLTITDQGTEKVLNKRVEYLERELQRYQAQAYSVADCGLEKPVPTPTLNVLVGGSLEAPGEPVEPGALQVVVNRGRLNYEAETQETILVDDKSRRLALANWIANPQNPLTARVMVNRIWQWHFGQGLVATPNNFGKMGKKPTHPELLDWLANYFIEHTWSVKEMHRLIMRSTTYQQSANYPDAEALKKADSEDKLLAHFRPRRLAAEELRDGMLAAAGELSTTMGGPPVYPEINLEAAIQPRHIMGSIAPPYRPSPTREQRNRRTIYTVQIRSLINPMLQVFNAPTPDFSCDLREASTVTPQVFALFNSQSAHDCALAMADRISKATSNGSNQIEQVYRLAYGRLPTAPEKQTCLAHLEKMTEHQRKTIPTRFEFPKKVVQSMVEEFTGELFDFEEDWDFSSYEYNLQPTDVTAETRALADLCLVILNSNEFVYVY
jgi:hypothetical protein